MSDPRNMAELLNRILEDREQACAVARRVGAGLVPLTPFDPAELLTTAKAVAAFLADAEAVRKAPAKAPAKAAPKKK